MALLVQGREEEAVPELLRAAYIGPQIRTVVQRFNDHERLHRLAGTPQRINIMRSIASAKPDDAMTQLHVGAFFLDQGALAEGDALIQRGYRLQPRRQVNEQSAISDDGSPAPPSFLILGPHKSGTTSLHSWLSAHSKVIPPVRKELQFWSNRRGRSLDIYEAYFPPLRDGSGFVTGEASATNLHLPDCASDVASRFPRVKAIVLRRDPLARAYSHYQLLRREHFESRSFEDSVFAEMDVLGPTPPQLLSEVDAALLAADGELRHPRAYGGGCPLLLGGCILPFIRTWIDALGTEQVMVVELDYLSRQREATMAALFGYLGLPFEPVTDLRDRNVVEYHPPDTHVEALVRQWFAPHEMALKDFLETHPTRIPSR